jgi:hypothetical protein
MTLEEYLQRSHDKGIIDHAVRATHQHHPNGNMVFYIHPMNTDGDTPSYRVSGNKLTTVIYREEN